MPIPIQNVTMSSIEHAATWLIGHLAASTASLADLDPKSSLVQDALAIGAEAAAAHGVPVVVAEKASELVLASAKDLSVSMMHTAGRLLQVEVVLAEPEAAPLTKKEAAAQAKAEAAEAKAAESAGNK